MSDDVELVSVPAMAAECVERDTFKLARQFRALSDLLRLQEPNEAIDGIMHDMAETLTRLGCAMGSWESGAGS